MITWMNENEGFLMVVITFVYVVATGLICFFNGKSAAASREQIKEAQKQQKQNAGLQLYTLRKDVLDSLKKRQFDKIFWDVSLLFDSEISDSFTTIAVKAGQLEKIQKEISDFEADLFLVCPNANVMARAEEEVLYAKEKKDYSRLKEEVMTIIQRVNSNNSVDEHCRKYIENVKQADVLDEQIGALSSALFLKMQEFIKISISL